MEDFGNRLLELMHKHFIDSKELGKEVDVSPQTFEAWCYSSRRPSFECLGKLAMFLGPEDFFYLVTGEN